MQRFEFPYGLLIGFAGGLMNGFAVVIARYFGAGNEREMKKSVALTYILSAVIALVLTVSSLAVYDSRHKEVFRQTL